MLLHTTFVAQILPFRMLDKMLPMMAGDPRSIFPTEIPDQTDHSFIHKAFDLEGSKDPYGPRRSKGTYSKPTFSFNPPANFKSSISAVFAWNLLFNFRIRASIRFT
jgi:hypothetical protein